MTAAPSAIAPSPWAADSLTYASGATVEHAWSMLAVNDDVMTAVVCDPWDVSVDIDARRIPIATAKFKLTATQAAWPYFSLGTYSTTITLNAGWKRASGLDLQPIFCGVITRMEIANGIAQCEAVSFDELLNKPCGGLTPQTTWTTFPQAFAAVAPGFGVVYAPTLATVGNLTNPTTAQLATFRTMPTGDGDTWIDSLTAWATALGCWLRGSITGPKWLAVSDRWDSGTAIDLAPFLETTSTVQSLDDWAVGVQLTATWRAGKAEKKSTNYYAATGTTAMYEGAPTREIAVNYRPPGDVLSATDPLGLAYSRAYYARTWKATGHGRALWWLQPRQIATIAGKTGQIETITYDVDGGRMTVTIRPTSAY